MTDFSMVPTGVIHRWEEEDRRKIEFEMRIALRFGDTSKKPSAKTTKARTCRAGDLRGNPIKTLGVACPLEHRNLYLAHKRGPAFVGVAESCKPFVDAPKQPH